VICIQPIGYELYDNKTDHVMSISQSAQMLCTKLLTEIESRLGSSSKAMGARVAGASDMHDGRMAMVHTAGTYINVKSLCEIRQNIIFTDVRAPYNKSLI